MHIRYLTHTQIDKQKWDACIDKSVNGLIYAYSYYLDAMSPYWEALVCEDYEIVMPLTQKKKYGIHYLCQPFYCAQLGVFGKEISEEIVHQFLLAIPKKFRFWDIYLNPSNTASLPDFPMYARSNYFLSLSTDYESLLKNYSQSHVRNIKRSIKFGNRTEKNIPINEVIELAKLQSKGFSPITDKDFSRFEQLLNSLKKENKLSSYGVFGANNRLLASAVFLYSHNREYYILVGNHPDGRTLGASHQLIDQFIQDHAGSGLTLDFEGSSISSLAFFYKSFGASLETFPGLKINRLPFYARIFRK